MNIFKRIIPILLILVLILLSINLPEDTFATTYYVDLVLGGDGATGWQVNDIKPGFYGEWYVNLTNAGNEPGTVYIWISDIVSGECSNPESETGNISLPGELSQFMLFSLNSTYLSTNLQLPATIDNFPQSTSDTQYLKVVKLNPDETVILNWQWVFLETGLPQNEAQGDCLSFNINYTLSANEYIDSGALTIGYWQNKNGQKIIKTYSDGIGDISLYEFLTSFNPFKDLTSTSGSEIADFVYNIIKEANSSGENMNAMLKAQMLATALNVYFSDSYLGGNKIHAPSPIGALYIDLTRIYKIGESTYEDTSEVFGYNKSLTVSQLLYYAGSQSDLGGIIWYENDKYKQELAKDTFDAINNQVALSP